MVSVAEKRGRVGAGQAAGRRGSREMKAAQPSPALPVLGLLHWQVSCFSQQDRSEFLRLSSAPRSVPLVL